MRTDKGDCNINYIRIMAILRKLLESGIINASEYNNAGAYYKKLTGADIVLAS